MKVIKLAGDKDKAKRMLLFKVAYWDKAGEKFVVNILESLLGKARETIRKRKNFYKFARS